MQAICKKRLFYQKIILRLYLYGLNNIFIFKGHCRSGKIQCFGSYVL